MGSDICKHPPVQSVVTKYHVLSKYMMYYNMYRFCLCKGKPERLNTMQLVNVIIK